MDASANQSQERVRSKESLRRGKYADRACQECRRRRTKCDGIKPSCSRCISRNFDCEYSATDDHRGTVPKAYARHLQARVKLLEDVLQSRGIDIDAAVATYSSESNVVPAQSILTPSGSSPERSETSPDSQGMLGFDEHCTHRYDTEGRFFGPTSGCFELQKSDDPTDHECCSRHSKSDKSTAFEPLEPSPTLKDHLINCYFEWDHPWCQFVNEDLFRESERTSGRYSSPFLLNSILAMGSRYSDRSDVRPFTCHSNCAGRRFLTQAEGLLSAELKKPTITTIQALAILGPLYVAMGQDATGWLHHGMAIQLALDMGLNLDSTVLNGSERIPPEEIELRRQVYWALYCDNKLWSSYTGRVCTMLDSNASVNLPALPNADGSINDRRLAVNALQYALCTQSQILERIHMNMYAPKRLSYGPQRRSFFDSCLVALQSWYRSLHAALKVQASNNSQEYIPQAYTMLMVYQTSYILLAKPFLSKPRHAGSGAIDTESITERAFSICFEASKEIIRLCEKYRQAFGSFRRSPMTASHCTLTAALIMLSATHINEGLNHGDIDKQVRSCISILQELSHSWTPARRFCRTIMRITEGRSAGALGTGVGLGSNDSPSCVASKNSAIAAPEAQSASGNERPSGVEPKPPSFSEFQSFIPSMEPDPYTIDPSSVGIDTDPGLPWESIPLDLQSWYQNWESFSMELD